LRARLEPTLKHWGYKLFYTEALIPALKSVIVKAPELPYNYITITYEKNNKSPRYETPSHPVNKKSVIVQAWKLCDPYDFIIINSSL